MPFFNSYYYDSTTILVLIGAAISLMATAKIRRTYGRYSKVRSSTPMTGAQVAEKILVDAGITDVRVQQVSGHLTDHYDPRNKTVSLSPANYSTNSIAAISVAAHECGHAIQHAKAYAPLSMRSTLAPIAQIGSAMAWPLILIGLFFNNQSSLLFLNFGIIAFSMAVLFQIITLPVEFDASKRALTILHDSQILPLEEMSGAKKMLSAAALTYVAAVAASLLQLLRIVLLSNRRR